MQFEIDGAIVNFVGIDDADKQEAKNYIEYVKHNANLSDQDDITSITVSTSDDGMVDIEYELHGEKFERIRRITGYLTGSLDSWNDAKQAEERDRVKHAKF